GFADEATKWNLAWAVHAGVAYNVSNNLKLEFAYRFLHLGDAISGPLHCGTGCTFSPVEIRNIESHDFKIGMRWLLNEPAPVPEPQRAGGKREARDRKECECGSRSNGRHTRSRGP